MSGISLPPLFLTFKVGKLLEALLCLHSHHSSGCSSWLLALALHVGGSSQLLPLASGSGWLLKVTAPGLRLEVASPCP